MFDTEVGKIGAVICWENRMPLLRTAMYGKGIQVREGCKGLVQRVKQFFSMVGCLEEMVNRLRVWCSHASSWCRVRIKDGMESDLSSRWEISPCF